MKTKKKPQFWHNIRLQFVGFIRVGWLLIVSSSSAQISMGGRQSQVNSIHVYFTIRLKVRRQETAILMGGR